MTSNAAENQFMHCLMHWTMQVVGEPINFIKTSFALRIVAKNVPWNIALSVFFAFDVII